LYKAKFSLSGKLSLDSFKFYKVIVAPSALTNWANQAGCAGHAGAVTRCPSVTASVTAISAYCPPASLTSAAHAG